MPPTLSEAPEEISVAFFIYGLLSDKYDSMGGAYFGKDITPLGTLYDIYNVEQRELVTTFIMKIQQFNTAQVNAELERRRKASSKSK